MIEKNLRTSIVNLVIPNGVIEEQDTYHLTTTTKLLSPEQLEMIHKLSEVGIRTTISCWPAGVLRVHLEDKTKQGCLVLRLNLPMREVDESG